VKGQPPQLLPVARPFHLLIGDTGEPSPTKAAVADVRAAYERAPERYGLLFQAIGVLAGQARAIIATGQPDDLGPLLRRNHALLQELQVSSPALDRLVDAAQQAGALGAKLSGGGRGGNMLALVSPETRESVAAALTKAGAVRVIYTVVE
jgi:mevalonate kinase